MRVVRHGMCRPSGCVNAFVQRVRVSGSGVNAVALSVRLEALAAAALHRRRRWQPSLLLVPRDTPEELLEQFGLSSGETELGTLPASAVDPGLAERRNGHGRAVQLRVFSVNE